MRNRPDDLMVTIAISVVLALVIAFYPGSLLRVALGLVFLLALPGYVVAAAIFPDKHNIDPIERVALSIGLSVAIVPLTGLFIFEIFGRLEFWTLEITLLAFVIILSFVAWLRRLRIPAEERFTIDVSFEINPVKLPLVDKLLVVGIAVALVMIFIMLTYIASTPTEREEFSEIGIIGPGGDVKGYPVDMTVGQEGSVGVSVKSHELTTKNYSLVILLQEENHTGTNISHWRSGDPFSGVQSFDRGLAMAYNFSLNPNGYMNGSFAFDVLENGTYKLRFMLFYGGEDPNGAPSYENWIWIKVKTAG